VGSHLAPGASGACAREAQRAAVSVAANRAGLHCVYTLNEPTAAAFSYGITRALLNVNASQQRVLVVDLGGGTLDNTLLKMAKVSGPSPVAQDGASVAQDGAFVRDGSQLIFGALKSTGKRIGGEHVTVALAAIMEKAPRNRAGRLRAEHQAAGWCSAPDVRSGAARSPVGRAQADRGAAEVHGQGLRPPGRALGDRQGRLDAAR
jgi:molecular chaperone DnaK (HSP70)